MFKALEAAHSLSTTAYKHFTKCVVGSHIGQGMDLQWTQQTYVPTEEEYFTMVDGSKTLEAIPDSSG
jgi:geranylgeranyl pyrophosphate synthase